MRNNQTAEKAEFRPGKPRVLSLEDRKFYEESGYLVVKGLWTSQECDELLEYLNFYKDPESAAMMNIDREYALSRFWTQNYAKKHGISENQVPVEKIPFEHINKTARLMRSFMRDPRAVSLLEQLHEGPFFGNVKGRKWGGLMTQIIFKEPETQYGNQAWNPHQDNSYVLNPNRLYVTTNTFFSDSDLENGTMYVYPGSHKEGILPFKEVMSYREEKGKNPGNVSEIPAGYEKVDIEFKKGDMLFLNGDLVHGSYPNRSENRPRPLYMNVYIPDGEFFRPGKGSEKMFITL